jgi:hypothetical protein
MWVSSAVNFGALRMDSVGEGAIMLEELLFHLLENALFIFGKRHRQSPLRLKATPNDPGTRLSSPALIFAQSHPLDNGTRHR